MSTRFLHGTPREVVKEMGSFSSPRLCLAPLSVSTLATPCSEWQLVGVSPPPALLDISQDIPLQENGAFAEDLLSLLGLISHEVT